MPGVLGDHSGDRLHFATVRQGTPRQVDFDLRLHQVVHHPGQVLGLRQVHPAVVRAQPTRRLQRGFRPGAVVHGQFLRSTRVQGREFVLEVRDGAVSEHKIRIALRRPRE